MKQGKYLHRLFQQREFLTLQGKGRSNFWALNCIFTISTISLMVAGACISQLHLKMDDPFVNWVELEIPWSRSTEFAMLEGEIGSVAYRQRFGISSLTSSTSFALTVAGDGNASMMTVKASTIHHDEPLLDEICNADNLVAGGRFLDDYDLGLIVTTGLLEKLHLNDQSMFLPLRHCVVSTITHEDSCYLLPIAIRGVVRRLPGHNQILATHGFYHALSDAHDDPFDLRRSRNLSIFVAGMDAADHDGLDAIRAIATGAVDQASSARPYHPICMVQAETELARPGTEVLISFDPTAPAALQDKLFGQIKAAIAAQFPQCLVARYHHYLLDTKGMSMNHLADAMSLHFLSLDSIRPFQTDLIARFQDLEIDESRIRDKDNFRALFEMLMGINLILIGFVILSTCLFLYNLVVGHLRLIVGRLATLMAFGMSAKDIEGRYVQIVLRLVLKSWGFILPFAFLVRTTYVAMCGGSWLPSIVEMLNVSVGALLSILFCIAVTWRAAHRLLRSPLDLLLAMHEG